MPGRGVDQILPHPGDPRLWESSVVDARTYVDLAERANGPIARPVDFSWPWGDALAVLDEVAPDARVFNLETSITRSDDVAAGKAVHYRMNPENTACLAAARPDACTLANNHVLDFGERGLADTLDALASARIPAVGAGRSTTEAAGPVTIPTGGAGRVLLFSFGTRSSGIPETWAAGAERPGVNLLADLSDATADGIVARVRRVKRAGDLVVASIHWGGNWGYDIPEEHVRFARRLTEGGVDAVHGHSSHHPRPIEVHRGRLILYGCGDLIDDYEGISGYEHYRDDLRPLYFASMEPDTGRLVELKIAVMRARRMRLCRASREDVDHVRGVLNRTGRRFGAWIDPAPDRMLRLRTAD